MTESETSVVKRLVLPCYKSLSNTNRLPDDRQNRFFGNIFLYNLTRPIRNLLWLGYQVEVH